MEIFFLVIGSLVGGFFLIALLSLADKKSQKPVSSQSLSFIQFQKACREWADSIKLEILEEEIGKNTITILGQNKTPYVGGTFLVRGIYLEPTAILSPSQILEVSNMVVQERISKAILITTGEITPELPTISELAPMEFIDGKKLAELIKSLQIPLV